MMVAPVRCLASSSVGFGCPTSARAAMGSHRPRGTSKPAEQATKAGLVLRKTRIGVTWSADFIDFSLFRSTTFPLYVLPSTCLCGGEFEDLMQI
jgi:hypothetical protein